MVDGLVGSNNRIAVGFVSFFILNCNSLLQFFLPHEDTVGCSGQSAGNVVEACVGNNLLGAFQSSQLLRQHEASKENYRAGHANRE